MGNTLSLAVSVGVPLLGGMAIGIGLRNEVKTWYPTLKKPSWNPPVSPPA
jgi:benzodiazapine receptor